MRASLVFLHIVSCCWLVSATLSKTDAKKSHKAEAEVSNFRSSFLNWFELFCAVRSNRSECVCLKCPWSPVSALSWLSVTETGSFLFDLTCLDISSRIICTGEKPCCVRTALERHSEGGKEILCTHQENVSRTSAWLCDTRKSEIQSQLYLLVLLLNLNVWQ